MMFMDSQWFDSSVFDTYLLYGILGLLILLAAIGLIILIITTCCWCIYSISFCFCCFHRRGHRHLSYQINHPRTRRNQPSKKKSTRLKRQSSDVVRFSQLYQSCPHLIPNQPMNKYSDSSCTTINTIIHPTTSPTGSIRSLRESGRLSNRIVLPVPPTRPYSYIKKLNDRIQISRQVKSSESSSPSIDHTQSSHSIDTSQSHSSNTNIYESLLSTTRIQSPSINHPSTPIYETEWTPHLQKLRRKKLSLMKNKDISIIELPPDLVPPIHYFQQKQHPYDEILANRTNTTDSIRRAHMLQRLKDDSAFLY